jgi:hypothetical protein
MIDPIKTTRGKYGGGTYLHPELAVDFMLWLDPRPEIKHLIYRAALKSDPELIQHLLEKSQSMGAVDPDSSAYVYIIKSGSANHYKIGQTKDIQTRINQMKTGNPSNIHCIATIFVNDAIGLERHLHETLFPFKMHGEWFDLPEDVLSEVLNTHFMGGL